MASVQSVERALQLLKLLSEKSGSLTELSERAGLALSTTSRILGTLAGVDAVARDPGGKYVVGPGISAMVAASIPLGVQDVARPHLALLADRLGEAVALSVPLAHDSLTVMQIDTPKSVKAEDWTGVRWPMTAGASGLVMMATWPSWRVDQILAPPLRSCTMQTPTDPQEIKARLVDVGNTGVSWSHGEYVSDISSVASAIVNSSGRGVGAVICYGPSYRFPTSGDEEMIETSVRETAFEISTELKAIAAVESGEH